MSNIVKARIQIRGMRPYLFHSFTRETIPLEREVRTGKAGNDPHEWRKTICATPEGQLFVKASQIFGTIRDGARYVKRGRSSIQKDVVAVLLVESPEEILLDRWMWEGWRDSDTVPPEDRSLPVYLDVRGVVNPGTRGRNVRYRVAMSPGWQVPFEISWDETIVNVDQMHAALIDAGRMVGLGNGRSIGMGRFEVAEFDAQNI